MLEFAEAAEQHLRFNFQFWFVIEFFRFEELCKWTFIPLSRLDQSVVELF